MTTPRAFGTADGSNTDAFGAAEWALLGTVAVIWGSSFLWIAIGLESMKPESVALLRLALGAATLAAYPPARRRVEGDAWPAIVVIAIAGNAMPAVLIAFAQQRVESSLAGMINGATPLFVLLISILMLRRTPGLRQVVGLFLGFGGVALMAAPNLVGLDAQPAGVWMLLIAVGGYAISGNLIVPLQQKYGGPAVVMRALLVGTVLLGPRGLNGLADSPPDRSSMIAVAILGVVGTGVARALSATLIGRAGASRGALVGYLVPVVAIVLGVGFRDESVGAAEIGGVALVLFGAFLTTRAQPTR